VLKFEYKQGKNGPIPAFAKTDTLWNPCSPTRMITCAHCRGTPRRQVHHHADARGDARLHGVARRPRVYLNMYGAHTTRWSGGTVRTFRTTRKRPGVPSGGLIISNAIEPPPGYLLVKPDASQIEAGS